MSDDPIIINLSTSGAQSLRTCEAKYVYGEIERLQPRITAIDHNNAMEIGSWVHLGLATHYGGGSWKEALDKLRQHHDPFSANTYVDSIPLCRSPGLRS
jgi:RecB family exonuclease